MTFRNGLFILLFPLMAGLAVFGGMAGLAAAKLFAVMAELGGKDLVGGATALPDGVFYRAGH